MLNIKVLGSGCANCKRLERQVQNVVAAQGMTAQVIKVTEYQEILRWGVMSTPALVINETLICSGRIPSEAEISGWLKAACQPEQS